MKKYSTLTTLFCFTLTLAIVSCTHKKKDNGKTSDQDSAQVENVALTGNPDTLTFETIKIEKKSYIANNPKNPGCTYDLDLVYPSGYTDPETLQGIQKLFLESVFGSKYADLTPNEAAAQNMKDYIDNYQSEMTEYIKSMTKEDKEAQGADAWMNYASYDSTATTYNKNKIYSFNVYTYSYTGGAHGIYGTAAYIIDIENQKRIDFADIFTTQDTARLKVMLKEQLATDQNVKNEQALKQLGFWTDNITPDDNFFVTGKGITWIFNPYDIAPYSMGSTEITLSFDKLKPMIKKQSPILRIINPDTDANHR
ncbi:DUF3298 and DUF4163 domain-containing protein [Coprobacter tertius]|uniref:DUF3298 and DUF4163 domain-containing protein n=1 Tax=Coprobacter tertius TaxID=2944915 RepID=A0ABT1MEM8_9BACT|nr:DUF3298 and DUF4163 domain-containing protein [Coprobacter tertius]MCP9611080.1 DUF3298 and DUF4163 domain-containing protein [Coprobacter tertius]